MKILEYMKKYIPDTVFFVGSGSSFFFIGTALEFEKEAYLIDSEFIKMLQTKESKLKERAETFPDEYSKDDLDLVSKYTPVKDRKIIETYPRLQHDGIVIVVTGNENGKYWFKEEYINDKQKRR